MDADFRDILLATAGGRPGLAAALLRAKELLPTALGSAEIRERAAAEILRRSVFMARVEAARPLAALREACAAVAAGGINAAKARELVGAAMREAGIGDPSDPSLANPLSERRLELAVRTQTHMAQSCGRLAAQDAYSLAAFPAWELRRAEERSAPRKDWAARWAAAGAATGWAGARDNAADGRMVALKGSPVWAALGAGAGGFRDALGNPYPPFAYGSGMDWRDVPAEEASALGLDASAPGAPARPGLSPEDAEILEAARRTGFDPSAFGV